MRHGHAGVPIAVIASLCSLASLKGDQHPGDVPFELVQQHLIVTKGSVAGLQGLNLLIDTGTIPSMLDKRIAGKLRLHAEPSLVAAFGQTVQINSVALAGLRIGPIAPGEVPAGIGDLSYLQGIRVDAIVGLDVLARTSFRIDYTTQRLSFGPADRESAVAPMQVVWPFLTVRVLVGTAPMQLLVDTGSRDLVLFKSRMPERLLPVPWKGEKVIQHASGLAHLLRFELHQVTLGDQHWDRLPGFVLDTPTDAYPQGIDGVLGVLALGGTRVRFDFERGELGWSN
jgi:predicted aspartyl protease